MRRLRPQALVLFALSALAASGPSAAPPPVKKTAPAAKTAARPDPADPALIQRSVVRLVNYSQRGDWFTPWEVTQVSERAASGFVVDKGAIMTNAHVVSDSRLLLVFLDRDPNPYPAQVVHVAHDCDLALVRPREAGLLAGIPPLPIGGLPRLGSVVDTFGYPAGGSQVSITRGVVSRIDDQVYMHSGIDSHLTVQTDAAINPGNSGGPVLQDGRVVGVAFQAAQELENVGYMIPTEVVRRFLRDIADGRYDGYPDLGIRTSNMANPAARRRAGMTDDESGVRVDGIDPKASSDGLLRAGDVILGIDDRPIGNDGTVEDGELRIPFGLLADRRQAGEPVTLRVLRAGRRSEVTVPLTIYPPHRVQANAYDVLPRYYVYGGLVFVPLQTEMLKTFGERWFQQGDKLLLDALFEEPLRDPSLRLRERVVLLRRLDHPVNADLAWYRNSVVERVNGKPIDGLQGLIEALESNTGEFQTIELAHLRRLCVLDRRAVEEANADILQQYGIAKDRRL